jgi:hypothetical protein
MPKHLSTEIVPEPMHAPKGKYRAPDEEVDWDYEALEALRQAINDEAGEN